MPTEQKILDSLKHIIDPDLKKDIVSLGFVQNIQIKNGDVAFEIALTTPACPIKEEFKSKAQESVRKIPGVKNVFVTMTSQTYKPVANTQSTSLNGEKIGAIIAVSSCKGGVGKSTIASFMAQELAHRGFKVGLLDTDIYGPSLPVLFNLKNIRAKVSADQKLIPIEKNNLKLMSFGFFLGDQAAIMRGPIVTRYIQQVLLNTKWGELDYLFIDMPPGTGDVHLTITQSIRLNGAVIVTTPHTLSLVDVMRGILMFEKVNVPILGVIENMSYFQTPGKDEKHYVFGKGGADSLKQRFGIDTLAEIPILPQLIQNLDNPVSNEYISLAVDNTIRSLGKISMEQKKTPVISCDAKNITLAWEDGTTEVVSNFDLRLNSQDALSINEITGERLIKAEDIRPDIAAKKIFPLGNYAIGVEWNDGHSAGIYPYTLISKLSQNPGHILK